jgi:hypothetical protein
MNDGWIVARRGDFGIWKALMMKYCCIIPMNVTDYKWVHVYH